MNSVCDTARRIALAVFCAVFLLDSASAAQGSRGTTPREPAFMAELFPPDLIMRHAKEIALTPEQRKSITAAVSDTQSKVFERQWDMKEASEALHEALRSDPVDETTALAAADRVMTAETGVKKAHLRLLIRIKNTLRPEQRARLAALRVGQLSGEFDPAGSR